MTPLVKTSICMMAESKTKQLVFSLYFFLHMKYGYTGLKHPPPFGSLLPVFFSLLAFSSAILRIEPTFNVPRSGEQHQTTIFSPHVRESKTVLDSGFHAMDSGFQNQWDFRTPDSIVSGILDSLRYIPGSKAQDSGIHQQEFLGFRTPDFLSWGKCSQAIHRACDNNFMATGKNGNSQKGCQ